MTRFICLSVAVGNQARLHVFFSHSSAMKRRFPSKSLMKDVLMCIPTRCAERTIALQEPGKLLLVLKYPSTSGVDFIADYQNVHFGPDTSNFCPANVLFDKSAVIMESFNALQFQLDEKDLTKPESHHHPKHWYDRWRCVVILLDNEQVDKLSKCDYVSELLFA